MSGRGVMKRARIKAAYLIKYSFILTLVTVLVIVLPPVAEPYL